MAHKLMTQKLTAAVVVVTALLLVAALFARPDAQVLTPRAEDLRFQLLASEPLATPDGRGAVAGWFAMVVKDRRTGQCFVALTEPSSVGMAPVSCDR
jgi:hypothetical protein